MGLGFKNFQRKLRGEKALDSLERYPKPSISDPEGFQLLLNSIWYEGNSLYEQELCSSDVEWAWDSFNWSDTFWEEGEYEALVFFFDGECGLSEYLVEMVAYWRKQPWAREYLE